LSLTPGGTAKRAAWTHNLLYSFENFILDSDRRELRRDAALISIEPKVFDLLEYLIRQREHVVSKDDLIAAVWNGRVVSESALSSSINAARVAIDDSGERQRLIRTLPRKGIRFIATVSESQASAAETKDRSVALPDKPSIAVLPFVNMSGVPQHDYFADGMAEEIITALSRCNWLFVIARNSSFTYKGRAVDVRRIGSELGVRYILEGSVRHSGDRLRIVGQLIDATSGAHIWADRFDGEMSDVFGLQDQITASVVAAIEPKLQLAEIERLKHKPATNLDAYDLLLQAQQLEYEFTAASLSAALACLDKALTIDPGYAPAMALAAYCYAERRVQGWMQDADAEISKGTQLAARAVELGKEDGNVLWMAAYAARQLAMDPQRARDLAYRSLALNPNSAVAMSVAGWSELALANPVKAMDLFLHAERLSPRDPRGWFMTGGLSLAYFLQDRLEEALTAANQALLQNPRSAVVRRVQAAILATMGRCAEAAKVVARLRQDDPELTIASWRARTMFYDQSVYEKIAGGLRLAGLPN
jgi:TolB-like protein